MDRNFDAVQIIVVVVESLSARRAWIEIDHIRDPADPLPSLSARRAWIEIKRRTAGNRRKCVALRKESVDRNIGAILDEKQATRSLSARRAWIEIALLNTQQRHLAVALRKESVDRNRKFM